MKQKERTVTIRDRQGYEATMRQLDAFVIAIATTKECPLGVLGGSAPLREMLLEGMAAVADELRAALRSYTATVDRIEAYEIPINGHSVRLPESWALHDLLLVLSGFPELPVLVHASMDGDEWRSCAGMRDSGEVRIARAAFLRASCNGVTPGTRLFVRRFGE